MAFKKLKLLYLTTEDSSFWSHRLGLARAAKNEGAEVVIMAPSGKYRARLEREGFRFIPWRICRCSLNPVRELYSFAQVVKAYRNERPDIVHHIALKPIVYGGFAARMWGAMRCVNNVTGLGPLFTNSTALMVVLRSLLAKGLGFVFKAADSQIIVQNFDDRHELINRGIAAVEKTRVVQGFGIDTEQHVPRPEEGGVPVVMLASRMLWEKGVREFVAAAEELRSRGVSVRMVLVGRPDPNNPGCIPEKQLADWVDRKNVEWWGHRDGMHSVLGQAHVVCLPSYREGLPKVLLEAAACGRAVVTTNVPGCRQVVSHEVNGLLVPPRDAKALAAAIERLVRDPDLRRRLALKGRERVVEEFSHTVVVRQTLDIYRQLLGEKWPSVSETRLSGEQSAEDLVRS
jgi:glycosyltransferase involved in cell wall biosynthesis